MYKFVVTEGVLLFFHFVKKLAGKIEGGG